MWLLLILIFLFSNGGGIRADKLEPAYSSCALPEGTAGVCVKLKECTPLWHLVRAQLQSPNRTIINETLLEERSCSEENDKFCCREYDVHPYNFEIPYDKTKCGSTQMNDLSRIVGGKPTEEAEFPWAVYLFEHNILAHTSKFFCGGSLISKRYVVTAAHCFYSRSEFYKDKKHKIFILKDTDSIRQTYVRLGLHRVKGEECMTIGKVTVCDEKPTDIQLEDVAVHSQYNIDEYINDIALLKLHRDAPMTSLIYPICLPELNANIRAPEKVWTTGWGDISMLRHPSDMKLKIELPIMNWNRCSKAWEKLAIKIVDDAHICAGGIRNESSCYGDSGGPLMNLNNHHQWILQGVVSFGWKCGGEKGVPGVYARVANYMDWIWDVMILLEHKLF